MTMRVVIVQRFLPHYRRPFFLNLRSVLQSENIDLRVVYGKTLGGGPNLLGDSDGCFVRLPFLSHPIHINGIDDEFVLLRGLVAQLLQLSPNLIVTEDLGGLPNSLRVFLFSLVHRTPYLIWGLGKIPGRKASWIRWGFAPVIKLLYGHASGFICYSSYAAEVYSAFSRTTYIAHNAVISREAAGNPDEVIRVARNRVKDPVLRIITIGALRAQKRVDVLIEAVAHLSRIPIELDILGEGGEVTRLSSLIAELGLSQKVFLRGPVYDQEEKRRFMSRAQLGVLPGRGGLAIQEMLGYGLPVVTGVADGTERDLVKEGVNGYLISGEPSVSELAEKISGYVLLTEERRVQMSIDAHKSIYTGINLEEMVDKYASAVRCALVKSKGTP